MSKRMKFSNELLAQIIHDARNGIKVTDMTEKYNLSGATIYKWLKSTDPQIRRKRVQLVTQPEDEVVKTVTAPVEQNINRISVDDHLQCKQKINSLEQQNNLLKQMWLKISIELAATENRKA